jgi:ABC-type glycerol-3-phosphate transport system substrate-binding protein
MGNDSYVPYMMQTWWAQYDVDLYDGYFTGKYLDGGVWKDADAGQSLTQPGKLKALEAVETLIKQSNGYTHASSNSMSFAEMQAAFAGLGYGFSNKKLVGFTPNGAWLENEAKNILVSQEAAGKPQDIRFMKMPVLSAIVDNCPSIAGDKKQKDATLSQAIKAIDEGGASYGSVSPDDFARIKRARSLVYENGSAHQAGITGSCKNKDLAKGFLTFLASDAGARIYANKTNGLTLPFSNASDGPSKFSTFVQSVYDVQSGAEYIKNRSLTKLSRNGLMPVRNYDVWVSSLFSGANSANGVYQDDISYYTANWGYFNA